MEIEKEIGNEEKEEAVMIMPDTFINDKDKITICYGSDFKKPDHDCLTKKFKERQFESVFLYPWNFAHLDSFLEWISTQRLLSSLRIDQHPTECGDDLLECDRDMDELEKLSGGTVDEAKLGKVDAIDPEQETGLTRLVDKLCELDWLQKTLTELKFSCFVCENIYENIAKLVRHCKNLKKLIINSTDISCNTHNDLPAALENCKSLEEFGLISVHVEVEYAKLLTASLRHCRNLKKLHIMCGMDDEAHEVFFDFFRTFMLSPGFVLVHQYNDFYEMKKFKELFQLMDVNPWLKYVVLFDDDETYDRHDFSIPVGYCIKRSKKQMCVIFLRKYFFSDLEEIEAKYDDLDDGIDEDDDDDDDAEEERAFEDEGESALAQGQNDDGPVRKSPKLSDEI